MPHDLKELLISVLYQKGDPAFVCGAHGAVGALSDIELYMNENIHEAFENGDGYYLFKVNYEPGQYGEYGRCESPPYWELTLIEYRSTEIKDDICR